MNEYPQVLVACPTYEGMDYCFERFVQTIKSLDYKTYDILIIDNSINKSYFSKINNTLEVIFLRDDNFEEDPWKRVVSSRNKILDYALENNYDYVLMMDPDVIPPKNIITELIKDDKELVSGLYFNRFVSSGKMKILPVAWTCITPEEFEEIKKKITLPPAVRNNTDLRRHLTDEETNSNKTLEVLIPSGGCLLIKRVVFKKIKYRILNLQEMGFLDSTLKTSDEIGFMLDAKKQGIKIYCNTKIKCEHLVLEKYAQDNEGNLIHKGFKA